MHHKQNLTPNHTVNNSCWPWVSVNKNNVYKNEEILYNIKRQPSAYRGGRFRDKCNDHLIITGSWMESRKSPAHEFFLDWAQKPLLKLFCTFAAMSILLSAKYVCPMLKRFLPDVISCWEESVLPSRAMKFINASWNLPCSMKVAPSFQIRSVCTIDMSSILKRLCRGERRETISETNQNA